MSVDESPVDGQEAEKSQTPGSMLREAREKLGLTQQQMADKIFLKEKNIADIEADRLDENMSVTFAKGYVRMYAKQVGLNDKPVMEAFEKLHTTTKPPAKLQSFSRRVAKQAHDDRWMMVTWIIIILLLVFFVVWWVQQPDDKAIIGESQTSNKTAEPRQSESTVANGEQSNVAEQSGTVEDDAMPEDSEAAPESELSGVATDDAGMSEDEADSGVPDDYYAAPTGGEEIAQDEDSSAAESDAGNDVVAGEVTELVFTFAEDCWINIEDATGEAIAYGVKTAGRVMPVSGQAPFKVTLGAPDGVSITFDGEAVDISDFQDGRIARFSLPMQD